jgi:hypothetical protein
LVEWPREHSVLSPCCSAVLMVALSPNGPSHEHRSVSSASIVDTEGICLTWLTSVEISTCWVDRGKGLIRASFKSRHIDCLNPHDGRQRVLKENRVYPCPFSMPKGLEPRRPIIIF